MSALAPGAVIGIIGGGQLGRMSAMAAARLGYRVHVFSPEADGPAAQVSAASTVADYADLEALRRFADAVDVITFEFENLPADLLALLESLKPVRPGPRRFSPSARTGCWRSSSSTMPASPPRPGRRWRARRSWTRRWPSSACLRC